MNFSDALSEMMMRETEAAWRRGDLEHNDDGDDVDGNEDDIEDTFVDEMLLEAALRERERGRPFGPPRRRLGGAGPGRPRDRGEGHISMILNEIAALQQAVLGARNSGLPSEMLFSDRDFTEDDYEALLALDEGVENRKGAKADVINQLHTERVPRKSGGHAGYGDCCICLDRINTGQVVRKLECRHYFHKGCVDKWLKQKATCPICQRKIGEPV
jgi:E3 ubiquitin-protein ligase RNF38/44